MPGWLELTGRPLQIIAIVLAIALPVIAVVLWSRRGSAPGGGLPRRVVEVAGRIAIIALAQLTAMLAIFLYVNDDYGFYSSWGDLLGLPDTSPQRVDPTSVNPGKGTVEVLPVKNSEGIEDDVLVWLPPGYRSTTVEHLPVVMFLPGQPSTPDRTFTHFNFGKVASKQIDNHQVKSFVAVFPPIMIAPPRDTECVDVPGGPQAETWLTTTVPDAVRARYHVAAPGSQWSMVGFSAGALCSAKLLLGYPSRFGAAVAFAGEYEPYLDDTTGDLFQGDQQLRDANSARWLYTTYGMRGGHLMMVASQQDSWAGRATERMASLTAGNPDVTVVMLAAGGHNFHTYAPHLGGALRWLNGVKAFG